MKHQHFHIALFSLLACSIGLHGVAMAESAIRCDEQTLLPVLERSLSFRGPYDIVSIDSEQGLCEVIIKRGGRLLPVYTNGSWVIIGDLMAGNKAITRSKIKALENKIWSDAAKRIKQCVNFSYTPDGALSNESLFMFFDPSCSACRNIKQDLRRIANKYKLPINVIVCPVLGVTEEALRWIRKGRVTFEQFVRSERAPSGDTGQKEKDRAKEAIAVFEDLGLSGLPAFVFESTGRRVSTGSADRLERFALDHLMQKEGADDL